MNSTGKLLKKSLKQVQKIHENITVEMESFDTHSWDETKYFNADMNHVGMLLFYLEDSLKDILADHEDVLG